MDIISETHYNVYHILLDLAVNCISLIITAESENKALEMAKRHFRNHNFDITENNLKIKKIPTRYQDVALTQLVYKI